MKLPLVLSLLVTVLTIGRLTAQNCTTLGQNPGSAFPVCGTKEFEQHEVPQCGGRQVPQPCNDDSITDINPFWYQFKCYTSGTLGFEIVPENLEDDYDWQLFDITGQNPEAVYVNKNLFVACNWSGELGVTGTSSTARSLVVCGGTPNPVYSAMPQIIQGHNYLLLISHFTRTQSGYKLSFKGGTANITDPNLGHITASTGSCEGTSVFLKLDKLMKCSSIAADGSDFVLTSGDAVVSTATSTFCESGFSTDSIAITFDKALPPGDYSLQLQQGSDGNTLLDACDNEMPATTINFTIHENVSAAFYSQLKESCTGDTITFAHDGAHHVNIWNWTIEDAASTQRSGEIAFTEPGLKTLRLFVSNGFCTDTASAQINIPQHAKAAFSGPQIICATDPAVFTDQSVGSINRWNWIFGDGITSTEQNPQPFNYPRNDGEKTYHVSLYVTDATGCVDSTSAEVVVAGNCNIAVPSAFTPNHDGKNDELFPTNAFNTENLIFRVFNRYGQVVFESKDWQKKWDGNVNGQPQPEGTYVWTLSYVLKTTGRQFNFKGTTVLIR
jgi:gliding motility-associated-like protein